MTLHPKSLLAILSVVLFASGSIADEWPQYRGPAADGKSADTIGTLDWSQGPNVVWKKPTPLGFSSFAVADGKLYTLIARDNGVDVTRYCVAMNAQSGEEIWAFELGENDYGRGGGGAGARNNRGGDGPRSTPTVDGDRVYIYDANLKLICLNSADGARVWQRDILKEHEGRNVTWANATCPVIDGDHVFVAGGGPGQSLMAFNKMDGNVVWKKGDERLTHATPVLTTVQSKKQLIFFMRSGLIAVNPENGDEYWRADFPYRTSSAASPVIDKDLVYCSAGYGVGAGLFRIGESMDVDSVWRKPNRLINHWSTPVVHDGHLYGMFSFKKYGTGPLCCVELATGETKWQKRGFGPGNCIIVGDKVVALSDAGDLVIVATNPAEYQEIARAKVLEGKCWSTPSYSDGRIYIRSTVEAACLELK